MEITKILKRLAKGICLISFVYLTIFSIQLFWSGYHDLDLAFNMLNQGLKADMHSNGIIYTLEDTYLMGLNKMRDGFSWFGLNCILGMLVGLFFGGDKK